MHIRRKFFPVATVFGAAVAWAGVAAAQTGSPQAPAGPAEMPRERAGDVPVDPAAQADPTGAPAQHSGAEQAVQPPDQIAEQAPQPSDQPKQTAEQPQAERERPDPEWLAKQNRETRKLNEESLAKMRSRESGDPPQG